MSDMQTLELEITKLPEPQPHLVRDCAHQLAQLLARYNNPVVEALALELASLHRQNGIRY